MLFGSQNIQLPGSIKDLLQTTAPALHARCRGQGTPVADASALPELAYPLAVSGGFQPPKGQHDEEGIVLHSDGRRDFPISRPLQGLIPITLFSQGGNPGLRAIGTSWQEFGSERGPKAIQGLIYNVIFPGSG